MIDQTEAVGLPERLRDAEDRFLKWAYKKQYYGPSVISIPRRPGNIDALLAEAADEIDRLREVLGLIAHHRRKCHDYDEDMGHDLRKFDVEDLRIMESAAHAALGEQK